MEFTAKITCEVQRVTGKFASRDEIGTAIQEELANAEPDLSAMEDGGEYEVTNWDVTVE